MTELTSTQQQVLVLLANGRTTDSAAKEVGADRNTVSDWRRTLPEFQRSFAIAQYEQTLYWREQLQQLGTLAIMCIKEAMVEKSGNRNLRAAVVVLDRIIKLPPEQPELAGQRQSHSQRPDQNPVPPDPRPHDAENAAAPAQSCTTDPPAVAPDLESAAPETPQNATILHNLHNPAQPKEAEAAKQPNQPRLRKPDARG